VKVNQGGVAGSYPASDSGWGLEISLDVQTVHAVCPSCKIVLVEASSNSFSNLMAAVDEAVSLGATVVSNSYGAGEFFGETSYDSHFSRSGVAFTFSSGDSGYGTEYPAASRYVTAVGGTSLQMSGSGYTSETAWSGAGSGCSSQETKPSWQHDAGCSHRTIADVSADADPNTGAAVLDSSYSSPGWLQVGGTSLASPIIAAIYAQGAVSLNGAYANSVPYSSYRYGVNSHDVTSGSNGRCGSRRTPSYLCTAVSGYDGPSGLGTPKGTGGF
jgi:subtilase family serine protease